MESSPAISGVSLSIAKVFSQVMQSRRIRVFIVPTWFCILFNILLFALLGFGFAAHNLSVLACCFVVMFVELLSMIEAHVNLRDLEILDMDSTPVEELSQAEVILTCRSKSQSFGIVFYALESESNASTGKFNLLPRGLGSYAKREVFEALFGFRSHSRNLDLDEFVLNETGLAVPMMFSANSRGVHPIPKIIAVSMFPFGMFRVWREFTADQRYVAYPSPRGNSFENVANHRKMGVSSSRGHDQMLAVREDDYSHHNEYKNGDSLRRIDWRASSRRGSKIVKVFGSQGGKSNRVLRWTDTTASIGEQRLRELSYWVHESHQQRVTYKLELPGIRTHFGSGDHHFYHCLSILADYDLESMVPGGRL